MRDFEELTEEERDALVLQVELDVLSEAVELCTMTEYDFASDAGRGRLDADDLEAWARLKRVATLLEQVREQSITPELAVAVMRTQRYIDHAGRASNWRDIAASVIHEVHETNEELEADGEVQDNG